MVHGPAGSMHGAKSNICNERREQGECVRIWNGAFRMRTLRRMGVLGINGTENEIWEGLLPSLCQNDVRGLRSRNMLGALIAQFWCVDTGKKVLP